MELRIQFSVDRLEIRLFEKDLVIFGLIYVFSMDMLDLHYLLKILSDIIVQYRQVRLTSLVKALVYVVQYRQVDLH